MKPGKDFIGVSAFALIFNDKDQVLLVNHKPTEKKSADFADRFSMPGGTVEFGETFVDALRREVKEELDLDIFDEQLINHNDYIKIDKHWIALNFTAKTNSVPKNLEPEKISQIEFFDIDKVPENISEYTRECLGLIK